MADSQLIYRVYLVQDPTQSVYINSTVNKRRQTLQKIRGDVRNQKFARWAPFAGRLEGEADGWRWCFVNEAGQRVDIDGNLHQEQI